MTNANRSLNISNFARSQMVKLIEQLCFIKKYRIETIFLAVSIADRHLVSCFVMKKEVPCLIRLTATCTLIAAKLEQPVSPSFRVLIKLLFEQH